MIQRLEIYTITIIITTAAVTMVIHTEQIQFWLSIRENTSALL